MKKRFLAMMLSVLMMFSCLGTTAFAVSLDDDGAFTIPDTAYVLGYDDTSTNNHTVARYAWIDKVANQLCMVIDIEFGSGGKDIVSAEVQLPGDWGTVASTEIIPMGGFKTLYLPGEEHEEAEHISAKFGWQLVAFDLPDGFKFHEGEQLLMSTNQGAGGHNLQQFPFEVEGSVVSLVTYDYTGVVPEGAPALPDDAHYDEDETVFVAEDPALDGWEFSGWTTDDVEVAEDGTFVMPTHDVHFVGSWEYAMGTATVEVDVNAWHNEITPYADLERTVDEYYERTVDEYYERTVDEYFERTVDEYFERTVDEFYERTVDEFYERTVDEFYERTVDEFYERTVDEYFERTVDEFYERAVDEYFERTKDEFYERTVDEFYERTVDEYFERTVDEYFERTKDEFYERTKDEFYERTVDEFYKRTVTDIFQRYACKFFVPTFTKKVADAFDGTMVTRLDYKVTEKVDKKGKVTGTNVEVLNGGAFNNGHTYVTINLDELKASDDGLWFQIADSSKTNGKKNPNAPKYEYNRPIAPGNEDHKYFYNVKFEDGKLVVSVADGVDWYSIGAEIWTTAPSKFEHAPKHASKPVTLDVPKLTKEGTFDLYVHLENLGWYDRDDNGEFVYEFKDWQYDHTEYGRDWVYVDTTYGEYKLADTVYGEYGLVDTQYGEYELANTEYGDYELANTEYGEYELANTEYGEYELADTEYGDYELANTEYGEYEKVDTKYGEYEKVDTKYGEYEKVDTKYGKYEKVDTKYGEYEKVDTKYGEYEKVDTKYGEYEKVDTKYGEYEKVDTKYGEYEKVDTKYGEYEKVDTKYGDYKLVDTVYGEYEQVGEGWNTTEQKTDTYTGTLTLTVDNEPATLGTPLTLTAGEHTFVLSGDDFETQTQTVTITAGENTDVKFDVDVQYADVTLDIVENKTDLEATEHYADKEATEHYADKEATEHYADLEATRHEADKEATRHEADKEATRHEADKTATRHEADKEATRHEADKEATRHEADKEATRHEADKEATEHYADLETEKHYADGELLEQKDEEYIYHPDVKLGDEIYNNGIGDEYDPKD